MSRVVNIGTVFCTRGGKWVGVFNPEAAQLAERANREQWPPSYEQLTNHAAENGDTAIISHGILLRIIKSKGGSGKLKSEKGG